MSHVEMMMSHRVHTHPHTQHNGQTNLLIYSNVYYVHLGRDNNAYTSIGSEN